MIPGLTPGLTSASPGPRQAFCHELIADGVAVAHDYAQQSSILVTVSAWDWAQIKRAGIEQDQQSITSANCQPPFCFALAIQFWCIDVGNAHAFAS